MCSTQDFLVLPRILRKIAKRSNSLELLLGFFDHLFSEVLYQGICGFLLSQFASFYLVDITLNGGGNKLLVIVARDRSGRAFGVNTVNEEDKIRSLTAL